MSKLLRDTHPHLVEEWDYEKNNEKGLFLSRLTYGSNFKADWICKDCGFEWEARINKRTRPNPTGCIQCAGKVVNESNCLSILRPDLAEQWDYEKNDKNPEEYHVQSNKSVHWKCSHCEYEWKSKICTRARRDDNKCKRCNGVVLTEENCLYTRFPEIAAEWDYERNSPLTPFDVFAKSTKSFYWICSQGHSYEAPIFNRVTGNTGCRECSNGKRTSYPEQAVYFYIKKIFEDAINNYVINRNLSYDILIPSLSIAIEYDGSFYHSKIPDSDKKKNLISLKRDVIVIRLREKGLDTVPLCTNITNVDEDLNESIRQLFAIIINTKKDSLTEQQIKEIESLEISHESNYYEISSQITLGYIENNLTKTHPEILKYWDYEKNIFDPTQVSFGSNKRAYWKCEYGHEWDCEIVDMIARKHKCQPCRTRKKQKNGE